MSGLGRSLRCGVTPQFASGSLFGVGALPIPAGVLSVQITGSGAPGGDNTVYYPGQPEITGTPWTAGQPAIPAFLEWSNQFGFNPVVFLYATPTGWPVLPPPTTAGQVPDQSYFFQLLGDQCVCLWHVDIGANNATNHHVYGVLKVPVVAAQNTGYAATPKSLSGQPYISGGWYWSFNQYRLLNNASVWDLYGRCPDENLQPWLASAYWLYNYNFTEVQGDIYSDDSLYNNPTGANQTLPGWIPYIIYRGRTLMEIGGVTSYLLQNSQQTINDGYQPYIPPSTTGGPYTGGTTSCTLNSITQTFAGGYNTTPPAPRTEVMTSTGAGQTMSYNVPAGGQLTYFFQV